MHDDIYSRTKVTFHFRYSQHGDRRAFNQQMDKKSNWCYLLEKVAQIFYCKLKVILYQLLEKNQIM